MATRQEFCNAMLQVYNNHGVYIGGANGEATEALTIGRIVHLEEGYEGRNHASDINRDFRFIGNCYGQGLDMSKSIAGDCSGIIVGVMRALGLISATTDYRACEFQELCDPVSLEDLQPADFVFDKKKNAGHIGTHIGDGYVVESKGRDYGVVNHKVGEGKWVAAGRLPVGWFDGEVPVLTRELMYVEGDLMRGTDVKQCQQRLIKHNCNSGSADGVFGLKTRDAVIKFQTENNMNVKRLGVVGQKTWAKLWE